MPLWLDGWAVQGKRTKEPGLPEKKKNLNTELKRLYLKVASEGNPMVKRGELGLSGLGDTSCSFSFSEVTAALH